jgi:signal peptidase I
LGDQAIVNQAAHWIDVPYTGVRLLHASRPKRGDLVLIRRPDQPGRVFKRVIGLPGETVEMQDNHISIDGRLLPVRMLPRNDFSWVPAERHKMGTTVYNEDGHWVAFTPEAGKSPGFPVLHLSTDEYFLLGDNRDNSLDCRVWGPLKEDAILGKVILTLPTGPRLK